MIATTKTSISVTLELTAAEANWLKGLVQNCPGNASDDDVNMRHKLFHALPHFEELEKSMHLEVKPDNEPAHPLPAWITPNNPLWSTWNNEEGRIVVVTATGRHLTVVVSFMEPTHYIGGKLVGDDDHRLWIGWTRLCTQEGSEQ